MADVIEIRTDDDHVIEAYKSMPSGDPKGAVVVIQEIFGVSNHLKRVTDAYAADGYIAIAPSFFDRVEKNLVLGYSEFDRGRNLAGQLTDDMIINDINAAADAVRGVGKVGLVGYCWGGSAVFLGCCRSNVDCGSAYYGSRIIEYSPQMQPKVPVAYHYGKIDHSLPMDAVQKIIQEQPEGEHHIYEGADHGFNCDDRPQFNSDASNLARKRTLDFFSQHLA